MATTTETRTQTAPRSGWRVVAAKELADHFRSVRLLILVLILGLVGVASVFSATSGIREAAPEATGFPGLFLALFAPPEAASDLPSFVQFMALLAPLLGIAFGFDAVNGERSQGTLPRLLSQPIYRDDVINGKFAAGLGTIAVVLTALVAFVTAIGMIRLGIVPSVEEGIRITVYLFVSILYVGLWLGIAALCSVLMRRAASSALVSIGAWLILTLFAQFLVGLIADAIAPVPENPTFDEQLSNARLNISLGRLSPSTLYEEATIVLLRPTQRALGIVFVQQLQGLDQANPLPVDQSIILVMGQVLGLVALTAAAFAVAYVVFMRQEVRA